MSKRKVLLLAGLIGLFVLGGILYAKGKVSKSTCSLKGKKLYGKVKIVTAFPDFKVKIVDAFPDLKVKKVTAFPDSCGKWKIVDAHADFKVKFVTAFPDFTIKYVDSFPGVP